MIAGTQKKILSVKIVDKKKTNVFSLLQEAKTVSGHRCAHQLGISRQALHKQIQKLRSQGYTIQGKPKVGYSLIASPDQLTPEKILARLETKIIGRKIFHFDLIDSTQQKAKMLAERGEPEGTLVVAERQSAGRGRFGREWVSPQGGVWASLILRPEIAPQNVPLLSLIAALAISKAIESICKVRCGLKWPNDVLIGASSEKRVASSCSHPSAKDSHEFVFKKVCGILTEMSAESERINWVVFGFGINVNNSIPSHLKMKAISLRDAAHSKINRAALLKTVLEKIEFFYRRFLKEGFDSLRVEYLRKSVLKGRKILIENLNEKTEGKFMDIAEDGSLRLLTDNKKETRFFAGDISLENLSATNPKKSVKELSF